MDDKEQEALVASVKAAQKELGRKPIDFVDVWDALNQALIVLMVSKPNDRGALDRRYAVTITELEKTLAYFNTYVVIPTKAEINKA